MRHFDQGPAQEGESFKYLYKQLTQPGAAKKSLYPSARFQSSPKIFFPQPGIGAFHFFP